MLSVIAPAISFGLSAISIPGPLQAFLINIALRYGWRRSLWVTIAPPIVDLPIIIVVVFLLGQLPAELLQMIRVVGGALLLWIAWVAYQHYRAGTQFSPDDRYEDTTFTPKRTLLTAMAMNAISPGPYLFWSTVTGPLLLTALEMSIFHAGAFLLSFYGTFIGGLVLLSLLVSRLGAISPRLTAYLLLLTIALLIFFGTALIAEALGVDEMQRLIVLPLLIGWSGWQIFRQMRPARVS